MRKVFSLNMKWQIFLIMILVCFAGEQTVTISIVIPTVLNLNSHLKAKMESVRSCRGLVTALTSSLHKRFIGIFKNCHMNKSPTASAHLDSPFDENIYLIATTLDPRFALDWVDEDVALDQDDIDRQRIRNRLKCKVKGKINAYFLNIIPSDTANIKQN